MLLTVGWFFWNTLHNVVWVPKIPRSINTSIWRHSTRLTSFNVSFFCRIRRCNIHSAAYSTCSCIYYTYMRFDCICYALSLLCFSLYLLLHLQRHSPHDVPSLSLSACEYSAFSLYSHRFHVCCVSLEVDEKSESTGITAWAIEYLQVSKHSFRKNPFYYLFIKRVVDWKQIFNICRTNECLVYSFESTEIFFNAMNRMLNMYEFLCVRKYSSSFLFADLMRRSPLNWIQIFTHELTWLTDNDEYLCIWSS